MSVIGTKVKNDLSENLLENVLIEYFWNIHGVFF